MKTLIPYYLFHHKGIAILTYLAGSIFHHPVLEPAGVILFGHSSMDRMLGYGLKQTTTKTIDSTGSRT